MSEVAPPAPPELDVTDTADAGASGPAAALEFSSDGLLLLDASDVITLCNSRALILLRSPLPSLCGVDFWEVVPPAVAERHQREATLQMALLGSYTFLDADLFAGRWIEYSLREQPGTRGVTIRDISVRYELTRQLRDAEQLNRLLFKSNPNVMWLFDVLTLQVLAANAAAHQFYGYSAEEFLGLTARQLYDSELATDVRGSVPVLDRADAGLDVTRVCRHRMKDGEVVMVEVASGMTAWRGQPAILMTVTNISARYTALAQVRREHAALERQFREQTAQLEASRQEVNELTYALSNDLQSPLHVIDGFARRLTADCDALLDVPGRRYVQRIQASVGHMSRMLDDLRRLLSVSRATLNLERVDLSALCQALGEPLRQKYPEGRVELDIEPGLSCWGDVPLLTVAMAALLDNAWKFTARKPQAWVRVGLASSREGGPPVLCVADNGAGFDEAYAHRLFGNFQRLHSSAEFPGVGLGLAIVKRVVTRHGGRVWAESAASAGASFFLSLPPAPD